MRSAGYIIGQKCYANNLLLSHKTMIWQKENLWGSQPHWKTTSQEDKIIWRLSLETTLVGSAGTELAQHSPSLLFFNILSIICIYFLLIVFGRSLSAQLPGLLICLTFLTTALLCQDNQNNKQNKNLKSCQSMSWAKLSSSYPRYTRYSNYFQLDCLHQILINWFYIL